MYSKEPDCGILINSKIISKHFYIPYFYHQGSYSDTDVYFTVELFYNSRTGTYKADILFNFIFKIIIYNNFYLKKY